MKLRRLISLATMMPVFLAMTGCGTFNYNFAHLGGPGPMPYGGVRDDLDSLKDSGKDSGKANKSAEDSVEMVLYDIGYALDLPLSAIADTILLPITLYNALKDSPQDAAKQEPSTH